MPNLSVQLGQYVHGRFPRIVACTSVTNLHLLDAFNETFTSLKKKARGLERLEVMNLPELEVVVVASKDKFSP